MRSLRPPPAARLRTFGVALSFALAPCRTVRAQSDADQVRAAVSYFGEPAKNTGISVTHPQIHYRQDLSRHFGILTGYDADIVTGATPQVFGIDAVTSATRFSDTRHHGHLGFRIPTSLATWTASGGFAGERDYRSGYVSTSLSADLFSRNTTVAVSYTHNFDRICDAPNTDRQDLLGLEALDSADPCFKRTAETATRKLSIDTMELGITQIATPWLIVQAGVSGQILSGFQSNPYRRVLLGERAVQEHLPEQRQRLAVFGRAKIALRPIRGSVELSARGYADSWAVESLSTDLAWDQYLTRQLVFRLRGRWHVQDSAVFYRDANEYASAGGAGSYWTGDRELSALMNTTAGAKITYLWRAQARPVWRRIDQFVLAAKADLLFYRSLTKNPAFSPNQERTAGLIDAVVFQLQSGFDF